MVCGVVAFGYGVVGKGCGLVISFAQDDFWTVSVDGPVKVESASSSWGVCVNGLVKVEFPCDSSM